MASRGRTSKRAQPYDSNRSANWTSAQLKKELSNLGIKLSSSSIPKAALREMYDQTRALKNTVQQGQNKNVENGDANSDHTVHTVGYLSTRDLANEPTHTPSVSQVLSQGQTAGSSVNATSGQTGSSVNDASGFMQSTMNMVSSMQGAVATLQSTVNVLLQKQSGTDKTISTLADFYKDKTETTTGSCRNLQNGIASDELAHIDVVTDSVKKNILAGKYVNLACVLIPDYETPSVAPENLSGLDFLRETAEITAWTGHFQFLSFSKHSVFTSVSCAKPFPSDVPSLTYTKLISGIFILITVIYFINTTFNFLNKRLPT